MARQKKIMIGTLELTQVRMEQEQEKYKVNTSDYNLFHCMIEQCNTLIELIENGTGGGFLKRLEESYKALIEDIKNFYKYGTSTLIKYMGTRDIAETIVVGECIA